jgi:hypothetical protein
LRIADISFSVRVFWRALNGGWVTDLPQATSFSGLAIADVGCNTGQEALAMLKLLLFVLFELFALHCAGFGDNWDRALGWILFALVDGASWDDLVWMSGGC